MVLDSLEYNENYYNGRNTGIKLAWGYGDIRERGQLNRFDEGQENLPYNDGIKRLLDLISDMNLNNVDVLDVGGAVGNYSHLAKRLGVKSWTIVDYNIDSWCENNKLDTVDTFITGDAKTVLPTMRKNEYDVIFTSQFLECIDDSDLPDLITEMNRIAKTQQIHLISTTGSIETEPVKSKYNLKTLADWKELGFNSGTRIIDFHTKKVLVV
jgi:ubiquinone/menaquinone biosynthesis C-methylase UbiE